MYRTIINTKVEFDDFQYEDSGEQLTVQDLEDEPSLLAILKAEPNPKEMSLCTHTEVSVNLQQADDKPSLPPAGHPIETQDAVCESDCQSISQKMGDVPGLTSACKTEPDPLELVYPVYKDEDQQTPLDLCAVKLENTRRVLEPRTSDEKVVTSGDWLASVVGKSLFTAFPVDNHMNLCSGLKLYSQCRITFPKQAYLKRYARTCSEERRFRCYYCGKSFALLRDFKTHFRTHVEGKCYQCPHCNCGFRCSTSLAIHQQIHTGEKRYHCSRCDQSFGHSGNLKKHWQVHAGEKPHLCTVCRKMFSQLSVLKINQRMHTGEKPYQCTQCGKTCTCLENLKIHQRMHSGEKPYQCPTCGIQFSYSSILKNHQRTHTKEKPYHCPQCDDKTFTHSASLTNHQRIHTGERPYWCS
ncbi:hypothetical protein P4O66_004293 [Electrophorus voltai]|uniref:C2H2-type domain-containing protein n=1 Tax=Electrophorus voltai TaxID=2609070 RepID=A0AAD8ZNP5_9TELE|nr:hypothetical protein P4O66_004293 [Electrophorus voltai]